MTRDELKKLIADGETVHLECKLAKNAIPANFWETYSSFANTDGGTIVLGVKEEEHKFSVVGVDDVRKIVTDFWNTVHGDKVSAVVVYEHDVRIETVGRKQIVVVEVPRADRADKPVYVGEDVYKGTFRRNGDGDYRCSREDVTAMIRDSCAETADATVLDELEVSDLDQDSLRRYRILFDNLRPEHVWRRLEDEAFLVKIGERSGMGLSQLYGNWEEAGYARPQLSEAFNPERTRVEIEVEVTEKRGEYTENSGEYTEKQTENGAEYTENSTESACKLTETEERIVSILRQNKFATQGGISAQLGITRTYITKIMGGLQARKIIRRIGPDKGGYWEVIS